MCLFILLQFLYATMVQVFNILLILNSLFLVQLPNFVKHFIAIILIALSMLLTFFLQGKWLIMKFIPNIAWTLSAASQILRTLTNAWLKRRLILSIINVLPISPRFERLFIREEVDFFWFLMLSWLRILIGISFYIIWLLIFQIKGFISRKINILPRF